jgi:cytoskeletal protein RodZ
MSCEYSDGIDEQFSSRLSGEMALDWMPPSVTTGLCFEKRLGWKRRMIMRLRMILAAFVVLLTTALVAQTFRGTILGTVTDASGAVVSGASVKVHNVNTGQDRSTQTSADGSYTVSELPIGTYTVTISQSGFQTSVTNSVAVDVAGERRVDIALKPGQVTEKVEVSG